ncbi:hypothetical protein PMAYCL1PPCAC_07847, partial [Pristionchus mayeri]
SSSLTGVSDDRSDEHAACVQQDGQSEEQEGVDHSHLQRRRKKQAEERQAHIADTDIHRGIVCVSTVTVDAGAVEAA